MNSTTFLKVVRMCEINSCDKRFVCNCGSSLQKSQNTIKILAIFFCYFKYNFPFINHLMLWHFWPPSGNWEWDDTWHNIVRMGAGHLHPLIIASKSSAGNVRTFVSMYFCTHVRRTSAPMDNWTLWYLHPGNLHASLNPKNDIYAHGNLYRKCDSCVLHPKIFAPLNICK